jgi:hypothetical protein
LIFFKCYAIERETSPVLVLKDAAIFHLSLYFDAKVDSLELCGKLGMPLYVGADQ